MVDDLYCIYESGMDYGKTELHDASAKNVNEDEIQAYGDN